MYFRAQRKSAQDVSLSDYIDTGADGAPLELMDVISEDRDLLEELTAREAEALVRRAVEKCLTEQERQVAERTGISRSYVSRIEKRALEKLRAELEA